MKRAALSASTWLNAIGRPTQSKARRKRLEKLDPDSEIINKTGPSDDASLESMKAALHAAHNRLGEKEELIKQLDKELSFCRQGKRQLYSLVQKLVLKITMFYL